MFNILLSVLRIISMEGYFIIYPYEAYVYGLCPPD